MTSLVSELVIFFFKQKTAYEMRISDWSSDVCSSDLFELRERHRAAGFLNEQRAKLFGIIRDLGSHGAQNVAARAGREIAPGRKGRLGGGNGAFDVGEWKSVL